MTGHINQTFEEIVPYERIYTRMPGINWFDRAFTYPEKARVHGKNEGFFGHWVIRNVYVIGIEHNSEWYIHMYSFETFDENYYEE